MRELVSQRAYALALSYENLDDHNRLRRDPLLAGKSDLAAEAASGKCLQKRAPRAPPGHSKRRRHTLFGAHSPYSPLANTPFRQLAAPSPPRGEIPG